MQFNKKIIIILGLALLVLLIFITLVITRFLMGPPAQQQTTGPSPTTVPTLTPVPPLNEEYEKIGQFTEEYAQAQASADAAMAEEHEQTAKVAELLDLVPYQGRLFRLNYSYELLTFQLYIPREDAAAANAEFDAFLESKEINRSWITDLEIVLE